MNEYLPGARSRSVHLIARLKESSTISASHQFLRRNWFEIQVRSILEHAWAEIEHEIVYKSGVVHEAAAIRRFAALAGALELLDNEFLALREERNALIDKHAANYRLKKDHRKAFDVARLLAFLEVSRSGTAWRSAVAGNYPVGGGLEATCVEALRAVGLGTPASLSAMFRSPRFKYSLKSFAALQGIVPEEVSHLAQIVLAIAVKDARVIREHFPEMMYDPTIARLVERRAAR